MSYVIKMGQVESVDDEADGLRIKARLQQDGKVGVSKLPYAFPLLPKTIQTVPKKGEMVLVICSELDNNESNRYYIGPIISQPQKQEHDSYNYGRGTSVNLLQGGSLEPLEKISNYVETEGAYPKVNDIALVGRQSEDIVLKDGEIDLRCGIRVKTETNDPNLVGYVGFNAEDPAYIQLKHQNGIGFSKTQEANSVVNVVADKINLISHKNKKDCTFTDNKELIKSSEMDKIMSELYKVPYGELLVKALECMTNVILTHVHPYPGMPPCSGTFGYNELQRYNFNDILSDNIRIN